MVRTLVAALAVLLFARTTAAGPAQLELVGEACNLDALDAEVVTLAVDMAAAPPTRVRVETVREAGRVTGNVWFVDRAEGRRGPRVVSAASCSELVESIALVIAMALDEDARVEEDTRTEMAVETLEVEQPTVEATLVATATASRPRRTSVALYAAAGRGLDARGVRGQLVAGTRVQRGRGSLELQLRADALEERAVSEVGSIRVLRRELSLGACAHLGALAGCGMVSGGTIYGHGRGLRDARDVLTPLVATGLRLSWERALAGPIAVRAYLEAQALLTSTQFEVDYMPVWTSPRFEGSGGFGLLARFL